MNMKYLGQNIISILARTIKFYPPQVTDNKRVTWYYVILFIAWQFLCGTSLYAQYADHRNRQVDSLEQVLLTNPPTGTELANVYRNLMWGYLETDTEKSMYYARKCVSTAIAINKWDIAANGYKVLGRNFYKLLQYDSAMVYYEKVLESTVRMRNYPKEYDEKNIDMEFSTTSGNIGNIYNMQGMYHEAVEYYQKALPIFEKYDWKESQTLAYYNIGEMYWGMENYAQAEINFIKMDSLAYLTGDSLFINYAKYGLSKLYLRTKDYIKALQNAEIAYAYFFSHPEEGEWKAIILCLLSGIYLEGYGDDQQAEEYALQASQLYDELGLSDQNHALHFLSQIYLKRNQWSEAEQTALNALAADDSEPYNTLIQYKVLVKAYAYLGNASKVDEYTDKLLELQSSWSNKNYQSAIREMEVKYETAKKELRITALEDEKRLMTWLSIAVGAVLLLGLVALFSLWRWRVQKHRLSEQQIKQLQQEKQLIATQALLDGETQERSRLARDLHDRLGGILAAAKYNLADVKDGFVSQTAQVERIAKANNLLDDSIREMRRIAHHLMPETLSANGLKQSIADYCHTISCAKFTWFGDEARFDQKIEVMAYNTLYELVNNALKHSGAKNILVQIVKDADRIAFTVQDDGCGFDAAMQSKGMGLNNIRTRVAAYNGNLMIDSKEGVGTEVNVELKIEN